MDVDEWCPSEAADSDDEPDEPPPQTLAKEEQIKEETLRLLNEGLAKEWGEASLLAERNILRASFAEVDEDGSGRVDADEVRDQIAFFNCHDLYHKSPDSGER